MHQIVPIRKVVILQSNHDVFLILFLIETFFTCTLHTSHIIFLSTWISQNFTRICLPLANINDSTPLAETTPPSKPLTTIPSTSTRPTTKMTSYLTSYLPVIKSILPRSSPPTSPLPTINSHAPSPLGNQNLPSGTSHPTLIAFVRHCGCPFAAKEIRVLTELLGKYPELRVVVVQHSSAEESRAWLERIGTARALEAFTDRFTLVSDEKREVYAKWGIGQVGWLGLINGEMISKIKTLQKEDGIGLTQTGEGSWRWQNSGGFAVDGDGKVKWVKVAKDAGDMCDYSEAAGTVVGSKQERSKL